MRAAWLLLVLFTWTTVAAEQQLEVETVAQKEETVTRPNGDTEIRLVPAGRVIPGDKVVYTVTFTNVGGESADEVILTNPIDPALTYVTGSASGAAMDVDFSVDGGKSFGDAEALRVVGDDGERPARPEDYTHIRWTLVGALDAGATGVAQFAATVK
jgi:uncharacterized repeat protein (TIGR01451 family)